MYEVILCLISKLYNFEIKSTGYTSKCRILVGAKDSSLLQNVQTSSQAHPATLGYWYLPRG